MRPINAAGDQRIGIHGLFVSIDVEDGNRLCALRKPWLPQGRGPAGERFGERRIRSQCSQLRQKSLGVAIAVGTLANGEQRQRVPAVATQIGGPPQPNGVEEQEGQQQPFAAGTGAVGQAGWAGGTGEGQRGVKRLNQPRLVGSGQEEQAPGPFLPCWFRRRLLGEGRSLLFFPACDY